MSFAFPLFSLGLLVAVGSGLTLAVAGLTPSEAVPRCCRRRVDTFARRARFTVVAGLLVAVVGVVVGALLLIG